MHRFPDYKKLIKRMSMCSFFIASVWNSSSSNDEVQINFTSSDVKWNDSGIFIEGKRNIDTRSRTSGLFKHQMNYMIITFTSFVFSSSIDLIMWKSRQFNELIPPFILVFDSQFTTDRTMCESSLKTVRKK